MSNERELLESIVYGRDSSASERLQALTLLRDLDRRDRRDFYEDLERLDDEGLDEIDEWFREPLTIRERVEREAHEILNDDARFNRAVQRVARSLARRERRSQTPQETRTQPDPPPDNVAPIEPRRRTGKRASGPLPEPF